MSPHSANLSRNPLRQLNLFLAVMLMNAAFGFSASAQDSKESVAFDAPSLAVATVLGGELAHSTTSTQKTIQVVIPVTTQIQLSERNNVKEFRFDVFWNRSVYPICDYSPNTQTTSEVEGLVDVDKASKRNATIGLNVSGGYQDVAKLSGDSNLGYENSTKRHYREIPQHEVLVASGTIRRGTGAFFRFHPSRTETLEGGRDLVVAFQVPRSWRAGLLQVDCHALGDRKVFGGWSDPFEYSRAFILPIYIEGDDQARQLATEFVRKEQILRQKWNGYRPSESPSFMAGFQNVFAGSRSTPQAKLPQNWVHQLIQSSDRYLEKYRSRLPTKVAEAAGHFVSARVSLLKLSR